MNIKEKLKHLLINKIYPFRYYTNIYKRFSFYQVDSKFLFLSFDCDKNTDIHSLNKVLEILNEFNVKVNFAIPACYIENNKDLILKIIKNGHEIINHTFSHPDNFVNLNLEIQKEEIKKADIEFKTKLDYAVKGFRAPHFGWFYYKPDNLFELLNFIKELGYCYSSTTVLSWFINAHFENNKDVLIQKDFKEIPLSPNPLRPLEAFDSYYFFQKNRNSQFLDKKQKVLFFRLFQQLLETNVKYQTPINLYFDPQDVVKNNFLIEIIDLINSYKFKYCRYSDFCDSK